MTPLKCNDDCIDVLAVWIEFKSVNCVVVCRRISQEILVKGGVERSKEYLMFNFAVIKSDSIHFVS